MFVVRRCSWKYRGEISFLFLAHPESLEIVQPLTL